MQTEEWEEAFREKVDGLDTPPPQTQWNHARSWRKLEKRLANQSEPGERKLAWWVYAVAAMVLLIPACVTLYQLNRQNHEIHQLKTALTKAKTRNPSSLRSHNIPQETAVVETAVVDTAGETKKTLAYERQIMPANRLIVNQENRSRQGQRKKTTRSTNDQRPGELPVAEQTFAEKLVENTPMLADTAGKNPSVAPASKTVVTIIRKAPKSPVARTVVFVFQGNKTEHANTRLADASPKPAKKFIFLSGEKEANAATKPPEAQNPFLFTAKHKVNP